MMNEHFLRMLAKMALATNGIDSYLDNLYELTPPSPDYYRFAYFLAQAMNPDIIVELGTQYARCTAHFAAGAPDALVITVDAVDCSENDVFSKYCNIVVCQSQSDDPMTLDKVGDGTVDICFADTQHQTGHVLREIELWTPKMKKGAVWLIDDLREMPDLIAELPFEVKGTLVGIHTAPTIVPENIVDVGFGYAIVTQEVMLRDTEFVISGTGRYLWLLKPLLYFYEKYMPVPLLFFLDRPVEEVNSVEVFLQDMDAYHEPCGKLIKDALQRLDKPIVMLGFMDFLPIRKVDLRLLQILEQYMIGDCRVARGNIWASADKTVMSSKEVLCEGKGFSIRKLSSKLHGQVGATALAPALWRRDFLLEFIEDDWTLDALELPGQYKFMAQNKWYSVGMLPGVFHSCHLCYTADRNEVRLSTIENEEDRAYIAQFVPKGKRIS